MGSRFVKNESAKLPISEGDFVIVKKRLSHGEREDMFAVMAPLATPGEGFKLQRREVRTAKVLTYLIGWSLTDEDQPVPMSELMTEDERTSTIRSLDPDTFDEIYEAIEQHEESMTKKADVQKKVSTGESESSATSTSAA